MNQHDAKADQAQMESMKDLELTNEQAEMTKAGGAADRDKLQTYIELKLES